MKFDYSIPRYWYHITQKHLGNSITLNPISTQCSTNRCYAEPDISRICVAPTIPQCMVAIPLEYEMFYYDVYNSKGVFVYQTAIKKVAKEPFFPENEKKHEDPTLPFDYKVTNEGWLLKDTKFNFVGKINADFDDKSLHNINFETCCDDNPQLTGRVLSKIIKSPSFYLIMVDGSTLKLVDFDHNVRNVIRKSKKVEEKACVLI